MMALLLWFAVCFLAGLALSPLIWKRYGTRRKQREVLAMRRHLNALLEEDQDDGK